MVVVVVGVGEVGREAAAERGGRVRKFAWYCLALVDDCVPCNATIACLSRSSAAAVDNATNSLCTLPA